MRATLRVTGDDLVERRLLGLRERLRDPRQAMTRAGTVIAQANYDRILSGKGGKRLAPTTLRRKRRLGQPTKRLIAEGRLLASLKPPAGGRTRLAVAFGRGDARFDVRGSVVRYGTRIDYARFQKGDGGRVVSVNKATRARAVLAIRDELTDDL
jgi:hypothetical protein